MRRTLITLVLALGTFTMVIAGDARAVDLAPLTGTVTDLDDSPVAGARVALISQTSPTDEFMTVTDLDGTYSVVAPDGPYSFSVSKRGFAASDATQVILDATDPQVLDVRLTELPATVLSGRLVNSEGHPVTGTVQPSESGFLDPLTHTDSDGTFSISLDGGVGWQLTISAPGYQDQILPGPFDTTADLGVLVMADGVFVAGTVRNSAGLAIAGAEVHAYGSGGWTFAGPVYTGGDGSYLLSLPTAGTWSIRAIATGYVFADAGTNVTVEIGTTTLDIVLLRAGVLEGQVTFPDGSPAPFAQLQFDGSQGAFTDSEGRYSTPVAPGTYTFIARWLGFSSLPVTAVVVEDGTTVVDVRLRAPSTITLRNSDGIVGSETSPDGPTGVVLCVAPGLATAVLFQCDDGRPWAALGFVNAEGVWNVPALPLGDYRARWGAGGVVALDWSFDFAIGPDRFDCDFYIDNSSPSRCISDGIPDDFDGNGDGIPDSEQTFVASSADPTGGAVTLASPGESYPLTNVTVTDPTSLPPLPSGTTGQSGVIGFTVSLPDGQTTADIDVYRNDPTGVVDSYWKWNGMGWFDATSLATFTHTDDGRTKTTLRLTDGAFGDLDGEVNGQIVDPGVLTVTVNNPPIANNDSATTVGTRPVTIDVLKNDVDVESGKPTGSQIATPPANGTVTVNEDGSIRYTANTHFDGTDSFTYTASDGTKWSAPATVTVKVRCPSGTPSGQRPRPGCPSQWPPSPS
jgi:hypothetical protein